MSFDPDDLSPIPFSDTWTWNGATWTQQFPPSSPPARVDASMAYDAARRQVVLFGGYDLAAGRVSSDTWTWDGTTWTKQSPPLSPPAAAHASMTFDAAAQTVVLYGTGPNGNQTWLWNGSTWTASASGPAGRFGAVISYDAGLHRTVLYGGHDGRTTFTDTWLRDGARWVPMHLPTQPPPRGIDGIVYDSFDHRQVLVLETDNPYYNVSETWVLKDAPVSTLYGYWLVTSNGAVIAFGNACNCGSAANLALAQPIVGMARTPTKRGYWLVARDGGIFRYGNAHFYGSTGNLRLNEPIVGMTATPSGHGYWLVARDGGIFAYGDAHFYGSTGNVHLNQPIVAMTSSHDGHGYLFVGADGGIFSYGNAQFYGSAANVTNKQPIVAMMPTDFADGYWLVGRDGKVYPYGAARSVGSAENLGSTQPVAGAAAT
jgi:hypothetical protein